MRNYPPHPPPRPFPPEQTSQDDDELRLPLPTASYRKRAWLAFQRALDPLAPVKPLPPPRP